MHAMPLVAPTSSYVLASDNVRGRSTNMTRLLSICCALALTFFVSAFAHAQTSPDVQTPTAKTATKTIPKAGRISRNAWPRTRVTVSKRYTGTPGYGFLPGYEPPPRRPLYGPQDTHYYPRTYPWYGWPGNYRGRWNGGGFGPCWAKTPIGPMWN